MKRLKMLALSLLFLAAVSMVPGCTEEPEDKGPSPSLSPEACKDRAEQRGSENSHSSYVIRHEQCPPNGRVVPGFRAA